MGKRNGNDGNDESDGRDGCTSSAHQRRRVGDQANVEMKDENGEMNNTQLTKAIEKQDFRLVQKMLDGKVDVSRARDSLRAPLLVATKMRMPRIVEVLLKAGANVDVKDREGKRGETALMKAIEVQSGEIVQILLNAKADVAKMQNYTAALHVACYHGHVSLVEMLVAKKRYRTTW